MIFLSTTDTNYYYFILNTLLNYLLLFITNTLNLRKKESKKEVALFM